jgi:hypothetical protein
MLTASGVLNSLGYLLSAPVARIAAVVGESGGMRLSGEDTKALGSGGGLSPGWLAGCVLA